MSNQSHLASNDRVVRLFVSSTFRDMQAERNELTTRTFQRLRKLCESIGVIWSEVDLRWGITDEQRLHDQVLPICLAEIDACRPYFVGILGQRYGWECRAFAPGLIDRYPWLKGHEGASISELEFLYGALNDTGAACRAFFYFRSPMYLDQLSPVERARHRESPLDEEGGRWEAARIRSRKLARLKRRIRMSGLPLRDQYPDPHVLGELVYQDLERAIREDFPEQIPEDPLTRDRRNHEGYARTRNRIYLPRPRDYKRLDTHANAKGPPLVVLGPSGIGKSALLANWSARYRSARPERPLVEYYVGASAESTDWRQLVVGVLGELGVSVPKSATGPEALRVAFAGGLQRVAASGGCVLILDAINQLEDREGALDLAWLPPSLPQNVRVIMSTLEGRVLLECRRRRWVEMSIRELRRVERRRLIALYLERMYSKRLSAGQVERIARAPLAANPLWLIVVLEELRLYGEHETLDRQIEFYLGARSIEELFELVLRRWETDYERERPALVRDAMRALWAARQGLSESEIRELLGGPEGPLPSLVWSIFQFAADHSLVSRSGLIGFFHTYLRRAVERRYLQNDDERRAAHCELAAYFQNREPSPRQIQELPWQLARGEAWDHLYNLLRECEFFRSAWAVDELNVKRYWTDLEERGGRSRLAAYAPVLEAPADYQEVADDVATLLAEAGYLRETLPVYKRLVETFERSGETLELARALTRQARLADVLGQRHGALEAHGRAETIFRQFGARQDLLVSLGEQAQIRISQGAPDRALSLLEEAEQLAVEREDEDSLQALLVSRAAILIDWEKFDEAEAYLTRAEKICVKQGNSDGLQRVYGYQVRLLTAQRRFEDALHLCEEKERICAELGDRSGRAGAINDRAVLLANTRRKDEALELLDAAEDLYRGIGSRSGLAFTAGNRASVLQQLGRLDEALALFQRQEQLYREIDELADLDTCLFNQAVLAEKMERPDQARVLYDRAADAAERVGREGTRSIAATNKARLLGQLGETTEAYRLLKDALQTFLRLGNRWEAARALRFMADTLLAVGRTDDAMAAAKWAERLGHEMGSTLAVAHALDRQAEIFNGSEQFDDALLAREQEAELRRQAGDEEGLVPTLGKAVSLAWRLGKTPKVVRLLNEQADVLLRLGRQTEMRELLEMTISKLHARHDLDTSDREYLAGLEKLLERIKGSTPTFG